MQNLERSWKKMAEETQGKPPYLYDFTIKMGDEESHVFRGLYNYDTDKFDIPKNMLKAFDKRLKDWDIIQSVGYNVV